MPGRRMVDVLLVGAGPTGLTLACELLRRGVSCELVDAAAQPSTTSKATVVSPRTLEVLDALELGERALAEGQELRGVCCYSNGRLLGRLPANPRTDTRFPFPLVLPQRDTERLLLDRLADLGGRVERGCHLTALHQNAERVVGTVQGPSAVAEIAARWVVGCDGAHSTVRAEAGIEFGGSAYPETFVLIEAHARPALRTDEGHFFLSSFGVVVFVSLPEGRCRVTLDLPGRSESDLSPGHLQDELDRRGAGKVRIDTVSWSSRYRISNRLAGTYRKGRILLAGDAAHLHSPVGGQGMNTGIQDAFNLGWKLASVLAGDAPERFLDSYEAERRPLARRVVRATNVVSRLGLGRGSGTDHVRGLLLRGAIGTDLAKRLVPYVTQLGLAYRGSPIVDPHRAGGGPLRAGERAPDGLLANGAGRLVRLHELFRHGGHTLLVFGSSPQEAAELAELAGAARVAVHVVARTHPDGGSVMVDMNGAAHHHYRVPAQAVILVRPDGHVAAAADSVDAETTRRMLLWLPTGR